MSVGAVTKLDKEVTAGLKTCKSTVKKDEDDAVIRKGKKRIFEV